ncbi:MAG: hypothetical protein HKM89_12490 [Gemmatimonadales bacterium]|nr:hypothetical protein [Gemmatimonadales bacterium]
MHIADTHAHRDVLERGRGVPAVSNEEPVITLAVEVYDAPLRYRSNRTPTEPAARP